MKRTIARKPKICHTLGMVKLALPFIVYSLQFITVYAATLPLESFQPVDWFDTAALLQSPAVGLKNLQETDAIYVSELPLPTGPRLKISLEATLSPSNSIWICCGSLHDPDAFRIGIEAGGQFTLLVGSQIRPFDTKLPTLPSGDHTYRLELVIDTFNFKSADIKVSADGGAFSSAGHIAPPPSAWQGASPPDTWTLATASLRGNGATLREFSYSMVGIPTLILVR